MHCKTFVNTLYLHFARPCYIPYSLFFILYLKEKEKGKKDLKRSLSWAYDEIKERSDNK
jgi:hypothetical protein